MSVARARRPGRLLRLRVQRAEPLSRGQWLRVLGFRVTRMLGRVACRLGLPGAVQPMETIDPVTGQRISVHVGPLGTTLSVGGRDYTFSRFRGAWVGEGGSV